MTRKKATAKAVRARHMNNAVYTPRPWMCYKIGESENLRLITSVQPSGVKLVGYAQGTPNARLMTAAPDLLEALRGFDPSNNKKPGDLARAWETARAAIAKATGKAAL